jgi:hypothetical protein
MRAKEPKHIGAEVFYDEGRKQALIYLYTDKKEDGESALAVYERWMSQPDFDEIDEWNYKKFAFNRGWTAQIMN